MLLRSRGSLLGLPEKGWAPFDYIDCCGVLHHLAEPAAGLAALVSVLAQGGGLGLMLYGELGRTGVYPAQRAIARLAGGGPAAERLALARRLLDALPDRSVGHTPETQSRRNLVCRLLLVNNNRFEACVFRFDVRQFRIVENSICTPMAPAT